MTTWVNGAPADVLGGDTLGTTYWEDGTPVALLVTQGVVTLSADVFDTVTGVENVAVTLPLTTALQANVNDAVSVASAIAEYTSPTLIEVADSVGVAESTGYSTLPPMEVAVFDAATVVENLRRSGPITVRVDESITIGELCIRVAKVPFRSTRTEITYIREFVKAQLYTGGGLGVHVHESVTVAQNPFYFGYQPQAGTSSSQPDYDTIGAGPNPAVPAAPPGTDYWVSGI